MVLLTRTTGRYERPEDPNVFVESSSQCPRKLAGRDFWGQDGAPFHHYSRLNGQWLNDHCPDRWIGRTGVVEWPSISPDFTPMGFFLWSLDLWCFKLDPSSTSARLKKTYRMTEDCRFVQVLRAMYRKQFQNFQWKFENVTFMLQTAAWLHLMRGRMGIGFIYPYLPK